MHIVIVVNSFSDLHKYQCNFFTFHLVLVGCFLRAVPSFVTWLTITTYIFITVVKKKKGWHLGQLFSLNNQ